MSIRKKRVCRSSEDCVFRVIVGIVLLLSVSRAASAMTQNEFCLAAPSSAPEQTLCGNIYNDPLYYPLLHGYSLTQPDLQWQVVKILREYSYKHTTWAPGEGSPLLIGTTSRNWATAYQEIGLGADAEDTAPHRYQVFDANNSGVFCWDTALTLQKLYMMFGYTSDLYHVDFDSPLGPFSHEQTLVTIRYLGSTVVTLQDPSVNVTFANPDGTPLDIRVLLQRLAKHDAAHVRMLGDINSLPNQDDHLVRARALFAASDYGPFDIQTIADHSNDIDPDDFTESEFNDTRAGIGLLRIYESPRTPARYASSFDEAGVSASVGQPAESIYIELFVRTIYNEGLGQNAPLLASAWDAIARNSDLSQDIVWQNTTTGAFQVWPLRGVISEDVQPLGPGVITDTNWRIVGKGDFDGDGQTDLLWRNQATGTTTVWSMGGTVMLNAAFITPDVDTSWQVGGVGDFDGDGKADILWRNQATGQNVVWFMNGSILNGSLFIGCVVAGGVQRPCNIADANWQMVGTGDFNRDGRTDILWRHQVSGQNAVSVMDHAGTMVTWQALQTIVPDANWQVVDTGDFNGDGDVDILWRHQVSGQNVVWFMDNAGNLLDYRYLPTVTDVNWQIVGK